VWALLATERFSGVRGPNSPNLAEA